MREDSQLAVLLGSILEEENLLGCTLSKLRSKQTQYEKVSLRPLELKGELAYQVTYHYGQKELHENLSAEQVEELVLDLMNGVFRQGHIFTPEADWQVLVSKKGAVKILQHEPSRKGQDVDLAHNRTKQYLLREGTAYPFLVELGVMNEAGRVLKKRYHKFRQLNKYLEVVEDCMPYLPDQGDRPLRIVDFGSGKAYLTFALYYYLSQYLKHIYGLLHLSQYLIMSTCHMCFAGTILNSPYHGSLGHCPYIPSFCFVDRKAEIVLSSYAGSCPDGGILLIPALLACFMCAEASF